VICSGVLFGNGERSFYQYFRKAWLQDPERLPYIGEGSNLVPTIHVKDLSRLVKRVVEEKPVLNYILGIDKSKLPRQKNIIQAISKGIGTSSTERILPYQSLKSEHDWINSGYDSDGPIDTVKWNQLHLKMKPSVVFKDLEKDEEEDEEDIDEEEIEKRANQRKFQWHCEYGIKENIHALNTEFNTFRGLNPLKIFVTGPPASGKSTYAKQ
jgi:adenylate kinase